MGSWPGKVGLNRARNRGFAPYASRVVLIRKELYFLSAQETFEQVENMFINEGSMGPYEVPLKGIYDRDSNGKQFLAFSCAPSEADDVELRVISAFMHRYESIKHYHNPILIINGRSRGLIGMLVDHFKRALTA